MEKRWLLDIAIKANRKSKMPTGTRRTLSKLLISSFSSLQHLRLKYERFICSTEDNIQMK